MLCPLCRLPAEDFYARTSMNNKTVLDKSSLRIEDTKAREAWNSYFVFSKECNRTRDLLLKRVYASNTGTQPLLTLHRFKSNRQPSRDSPGFLAPTVSPKPPLSLRALPSLPKTWFPVKQQHGTHTRPFPKALQKESEPTWDIFPHQWCAIWPYFPKSIIWMHKLSLGFGRDSFSLGSQPRFLVSTPRVLC